MKIWRLIAGALLAAVACAPSYAQQTKSQLNTYNNAVIVSNGVGAITANVLNPLLGSIINSACTIADSVNCPITALSGATANLPLIGAASGGGVTQGTLSGNTTLFPTVDSAPVTGNCAVFDSFGGLTNVSCSPSGSGTVGAGLSGQLASYPSSGTAVAGVTTGTGVLTAIGNAILASNGLVALDANSQINIGNTSMLATYQTYGQNNMGVFVGLGGSNDQGGVAGASFASLNSNPAGGGLAVSAFGFADSGAYDEWGFYGECRNYAGATGHCDAMELDATNLSGTASPVVFPYNQFQSGATYGSHIASGGDCGTGAGLTPCYDPVNHTYSLNSSPTSAALLIGPNGSTFQAGIVFGCNGLIGTDCSGNGTGLAIVEPVGYANIWVDPANSTVFSVSAAPNTTLLNGRIEWSNDGLQIGGLRTTPVGSGGGYLCIDNLSVVYIKVSCP